MMVNNNRYAAIYARQSVDKKDSVSIETQIMDCRSCCDESDIVITYSDKGFSGKNIERPQLKKLIYDIENGLISKVVIYKVDRISRNITDFYNLYELMKKNDCELISFNDKFDTTTPMGRGMMGMLAVFAEMERENISLRIKDNYNYRIKDRRWASGAAPFGFENGKIDGKKTLIPVEKEIRAVQEIFRLYATEKNISIGKLQKILMEMGLCSKRADKGFSKSTITRILKNPVYTGADELLYIYYEKMHIQIVNDKKEWNGRTSAAIVGKNGRSINRQDKSGIRVYLTNIKPVIDTQTFLMVQDRLAENSAISRDNQSATRLLELSGMLKCANCHRAVKMRARPTLSCSGRTEKVCNVSFSGVKLEEIRSKVADQVQNRINNFNMFTEDRQQQKKKTEKEIQKLRHQLLRLIEISKFSTVAADIIAKEIDAIQTQINNLQLKEKLNINSHDVVEMRLKLQSIMDVEGKPLNYRTLNVEDRQTVLRALISRIYLNSDGEIEIAWKE